MSNVCSARNKASLTTNRANSFWLRDSVALTSRPSPPTDDSGSISSGYDALMIGVKCLRVIDGCLEQSRIVRLQGAAAEAVGHVGADGDFNHVAVAMHVVVEASAFQGVVQRSQPGPPHTPVGISAIPFGHRQLDPAARRVLLDHPLKIPHGGFDRRPIPTLLVWGATRAV